MRKYNTYVLFFFIFTFGVLCICKSNTEYYVCISHVVDIQVIYTLYL